MAKKSAPAPAEIDVHLLQKYRDFVNDLIFARLRMVAIVSSCMFMSFHFTERIIYPSYPSTEFFGVRLALCLFFFLSIFANRNSQKRKHIIWWNDAFFFAAALAMCYMIYAADGASGNYYQAVLAVFWGMFIANSYYYKHNLIVGIGITLLYVICAYFSINQAAWNWTDYGYAIFMLSISVCFNSLMTKFYGKEHFRSFMRNEDLQKNQRLLAEANQKLSILYFKEKETSKIDSLTKIYNRAHFLEILNKKIQTCLEKGSFFYLVIFDIDHFKTINDNYGHTFGDHVIFKVAQTVDNQLRPVSFIGRYGGDEFMFVIDHASREALMSRLETIQKAVQDLVLVWQNQRVKVSASYGVAKIDPKKETDVTRIIQMADDALLEVKRTGRGQIRVTE